MCGSKPGPINQKSERHTRACIGVSIQNNSRLSGGIFRSFPDHPVADSVVISRFLREAIYDQ